MKQRTIKDLFEFSIINVDKPSGPTSFQVSDFVRSLLGLRKTSHCGTLDPAVSGVLPITLNRACKLSSYFMKKDKTYVGIMRLHETVNEATLKKEMSAFVGKISQMPPVRSSVRRELRERTVRSFTFIEHERTDVLFSATVEAGTYIRTLVKDLGENIGGAHMLELRRTHAGIFDETTSVTLYQLEEAVKAWKKGDERVLRSMLIPAEEALAKIMPRVLIHKDNLKKVLTGKPIHRTDLVKKETFEVGEVVAIFYGSQLVEVARVVNEHDVIAVPEFVYN